MKKIIAGLVVSVATLGSPHAFAQCGGGTHSHGSAQQDTKTTRAIEHLLSSEETRRALVDAVVSDRFTMKLLIGRIAMDPMWTKEAAEVLGATLPEALEDTAVSQPKEEPDSAATRS